MQDKIAEAMQKRKNTLIYLLTMLLMPGTCLALDNVIISEVLYDPAGTETGGEAVEIYNPTDHATDISGWTIKTESSSTDATIPAGTILGAKTFYLIADSGWSESRDNTNWPEADHEEAITMSNTDAGVALVDANGTTIDAAGWGDPAGIDTGLYEGTPAAGAAEGNSLARTGMSDTDDNSADLTEALPDLQNSSTHDTEQNNSQNIELGVDIKNNPPNISSLSVEGDEDSDAAGVQISPNPGSTKHVSFSAEVTDPDGTDPNVTATITGPEESSNPTTMTVTMDKTTQVSNTTADYNATADMEFHDQAGTYTITVKAADASTNSTANTTFQYQSMTAVSIDAGALSFTGAKPGGTATIDGDFALGTTDSPTVRNIGNTQLDIGMYGTDFTDGERTIGISNVRYSFDNDFTGGLSGAITTALQIQALGLARGADSITSLGFQLTIPAATQDGNYTSNITIVAMSS